MNNVNLKLAGLLLFLSTQLFSSTQPVIDLHLEDFAPHFKSEKKALTIQLHPTEQQLIINGDFDAYSVHVMDYKRTLVHFQKGNKPTTVINIDILPEGSYTVLVRDEKLRLVGSEKIKKVYIKETLSDY